MKKFSLKALGATLFVAGLVLAAGVTPAQAASMTNFTATTTSSLGAGQLITNDIVVTFTAPTAIAQGLSNRIKVQLTNTTGYGSTTACGANVTVTSSPALTTQCFTQLNAGTSQITLSASPPGISIIANTTFTFTIAGGTLTQSAAGPIAVTVLTETSPGPQTIDTSTINLTSAPASSTVTYDANGGSGSMANQTASTATNLTANAFTRSGYTFAGWATTPTGSVAFADTASYAFTSSATLYAVWTPVLATTGFDGVPYAATGSALLVLGAGVYLYSRRSRA